jgi:hypothetical protein
MLSLRGCVGSPVSTSTLSTCAAGTPHYPTAASSGPTLVETGAQKTPNRSKRKTPAK